MHPAGGWTGPSSPADALAKLASYDKAWITYLFA